MLNITLSVKKGTTHISSATVGGSRKSTGYAKGQGSHNTAYVSYADMVKLRVSGYSFVQAAQNLLDCYNELLTLPGAKINNRGFVYASQLAKDAVDKAKKTPNKDTITAAMELLLNMRNRMPLSRTDDGSKVVHKEQFHTYLVQMEMLARNRYKGAPVHKYYKQREYLIWELFDYQPTDGVSDDTIKDTVLQHILSMQATYEDLFDQGHLTISDLAQYFVSHQNWTDFTARMTDKNKINRLKSAISAF